MPTIERVLRSLGQQFSHREYYLQQRDRLQPESHINEQDYEDTVRDLKDQIAKCNDKMKGYLHQLEIFPDRHKRHFDLLEKFTEFEKSVFIMTKFPTGKSPKAKQLQKIIDTVEDEIRDLGFKPMIASQQDYHARLWDNVELYMLGCERGVAIIEDKFRKELNPNVAMEWGWMVGMGRRVLYLREDSFKHERADWDGLIEHSFKWDNPNQGLHEAIGKFLS